MFFVFFVLGGGGYPKFIFTIFYLVRHNWMYTQNFRPLWPFLVVFLWWKKQQKNTQKKLNLLVLRATIAKVDQYTTLQLTFGELLVSQALMATELQTRNIFPAMESMLSPSWSAWSARSWLSSWYLLHRIHKGNPTIKRMVSGQAWSGSRSEGWGGWHLLLGMSCLELITE